MYVLKFFMSLKNKIISFLRNKEDLNYLRNVYSFYIIYKYIYVCTYFFFIIFCLKKCFRWLKNIINRVRIL